MGELYKVGVIGWPIEHSISPPMHNAAFQALGLTNWSYDRMAIPPDVVGPSLRTLRDEGGYVGLNVTVPHKQAVMRFVKPDERALALGAANTIDFRDNTATNTDVAGLIDDLRANAVALEGEHVVVLGAGGAARAAVYGLVHAGAVVSVVNRTPEKAQVMLADLTLSAGIRGVPTRSLAEAAQDEVALIVNCTPVGMWPHEEACPWPDEVPFPYGATVYDMIYRPRQTRLMEKAEASGGRVIGGLGMLVRQGAASFAIWTGVEPPVEVMFQAAEAALAARQ
ncbi:MAG: shikimate dehydrogenase [Anaerolineae bacterium]|nr:shikimate dehydrogenase [Anaerolineae bacterium]